ncbi:MAG TPA: primary-amine oxidase [Bradyrhizobium sp.]|nr:primary-amine oxidase [Bradyrhizobium sp.]
MKMITLAPAIFVLFATLANAATPATHPLDPLSQQELASTLSVLKAAGHVDDKTRFVFVSLHEPHKSAVLKWRPGDPVTRESFVIIKQGKQTYEGIVDVSGQKVVSWREVKGVQPALLIYDELANLNDIMRANPDWQVAMRKRGFDKFDKVICLPFSTGYFGDAEEEGHRLVRAECYDASSTLNYWGRPIEGLVATVDLNERRVLKLIDTGVVPVSKAPAEYDAKSVASSRAPLKPITMTQPDGPSFSINGSEVSWDKWKFRVRMDPRLGIVISTVSFEDAGRPRSIMYEGHLSDIFVPYQDPTPGWYFRTYLDAGEYGAGKLASSLVPGADCPANARFFDDWLADEHGVPQPRARIACLFERSGGAIAWRHWDFVSNQTESRPARELVLRWIATIGNYDYVFDWTFQQDASIKVAVGATGIDEIKGVASKNYATAQGDDAKYGEFVADNLVGTNHDHFFCFKLDLDIDGTNNTFETVDLKKIRQSDESLRKSYWAAQTKVAKVEADAKLNEDMMEPSLWRVINPDVRDSIGYPVSYELIPGHNASDLLDPDDYPKKRGGFADYQLWVTPYTPQQAAAGMYPNQGKGNDGLPQWTKQNLPIQNTDIVLWYTVGFHHTPVPEDWPVLPTMWHEFFLRPRGFFSRSPVIDLPPPQQDGATQ